MERSFEELDAIVRRAAVHMQDPIHALCMVGTCLLQSLEKPDELDRGFLAGVAIMGGLMRGETEGSMSMTHLGAGVLRTELGILTAAVSSLVEALPDHFRDNPEGPCMRMCYGGFEDMMTCCHRVAALFVTWLSACAGDEKADKPPQKGMPRCVVLRHYFGKTVCDRHGRTLLTFSWDDCPEVAEAMGISKLETHG